MQDSVGGYGIYDENCKIHMAGLQKQYRYFIRSEN